MVELRQTHNGKENGLTDKELDIVLDALLHEMERHNTAADLVTDPQAREVINAAKNEVFAAHRALCALVYDPEA